MDSYWMLVMTVALLKLWLPGTKGQNDPTNVACSATNSTTLRITWTKATSFSVIGYHIDATRVDGIKLVSDIPTVDLASISYETIDLNGLGKYGQYNITIHSYTSSVNNTNYQITCITNEDVPDGSSLNFDCTATSTSQVTCSWIPIEQAHWNGILLGHRIQWIGPNVSDIYQDTVSDTTYTYTVTSLSSDSRYIFLLNGYTSVGQGTVFSSDVETTLGAIAVTVENVTRYYCNEAIPGMIQFDWEEMPCTIYIGTIGALLGICTILVSICACQTCCQGSSGNPIQLSVLSGRRSKGREDDEEDIIEDDEETDNDNSDTENDDDYDDGTSPTAETRAGVTPTETPTESRLGEDSRMGDDSSIGDESRLGEDSRLGDESRLGENSSKHGKNQSDSAKKRGDDVGNKRRVVTQSGNVLETATDDEYSDSDYNTQNEDEEAEIGMWQSPTPGLVVTAGVVDDKTRRTRRTKPKGKKSANTTESQKFEMKPIKMKKLNQTINSGNAKDNISTNENRNDPWGDGIQAVDDECESELCEEWNPYLDENSKTDMIHVLEEHNAASSLNRNTKFKAKKHENKSKGNRTSQTPEDVFDEWADPSEVQKKNSDDFDEWADPSEVQKKNSDDFDEWADPSEVKTKNDNDFDEWADSTKVPTQNINKVKTISRQSTVANKEHRHGVPTQNNINTRNKDRFTGKTNEIDCMTDSLNDWDDTNIDTATISDVNKWVHPKTMSDNAAFHAEAGHVLEYGQLSTDNYNMSKTKGPNQQLTHDAESMGESKKRNISLNANPSNGRPGFKVLNTVNTDALPIKSTNIKNTHTGTAQIRHNSTGHDADIVNDELIDAVFLPNNISKGNGEKISSLNKSNAWESIKFTEQEIKGARTKTPVKEIRLNKAASLIEVEPVIGSDRLGKMFPFLNIEQNTELKPLGRNNDWIKRNKSDTNLKGQTSSIIPVSDKRELNQHISPSPALMQTTQEASKQIFYGFGVGKFRMIATAWASKFRAKKNNVKTANSNWN